MTLLGSRSNPRTLVAGGLVARLLRRRRQRVLRDVERRSRWVEQTHRTPTLRQLVDATTGAIRAGGPGQYRPMD